MKQTEFDMECDVFFDECTDGEIEFDKYTSDTVIIPALEEFKKRILENLLKNK